MRTSATLVLAATLLLATPALAAVRDTRDARGSTPAPAPAPVVVPAPQPAAPGIHYSNSSHGSIHSSTGANTSSGNNQGGSVVTGEQNSTVTVVNVGPTSNNTQVGPTPPAPEPAPQCSGRDCPRTR